MSVSTITFAASKLDASKASSYVGCDLFNSNCLIDRH